jgi:hypothetical protein
MKYQPVRNFKCGFPVDLSRDQMKSILGQRRKNLLRVLTPVCFECKRDLYFNGGEIVETESEGEITDNSAWLGLGDRRFIRGFQQEDFTTCTQTSRRFPR